MSHRALGIAWLLGLAALAGCGGEAPPADSTEAGNAASGRVTGAAQATTVSAVLLGTATVPIQLGFTMAERPEPGRPSAVTLTLTAAEDLTVWKWHQQRCSHFAAEDSSFVLAPCRQVSRRSIS